MSQPETPRPESPRQLPPVSPNLSTANNKANIQLPMPSRSSSYTATFHSIPYSTPGPIRRRRTDSFFSFETGPTFTETRQHYDLCSLDQTNNYQVHLYAKMDRGFFRADQDWTCYRRNYFQISSVFEIQGTNYELRGSEVPCLLRKPDTQELLQVEYFSIGISARIANNDKKIEIVQHTPKRDKGPQVIPEPRLVRAGGNLHLATVGANHNIVTFERLQFKTATANNGKRRAAQQYYEIVIDLYANFSNQPPLCVANCSSAPLVVRGRSPGHYSDSHTRFRQNPELNMASADLPHRHPHSIPMAPDPSNSTHSTLDNNEQSSPNNSTHYNSMPNSPMSDFGPYPGYQGYPYPSLSTGYSSMMSNQSMPQYSSQQNPSHFQHVSKHLL
ncbi:hypothetical protein BD560DRAFT_330309 [Blakeslea trispora]|nr:hypothetical protein BD560DRAFT_330309 [Blakeslea trispora]